MGARDNGDLVAAAQAGSGEAWTDLIVRYQDPMRRAAFRVVGDLDLADDAAQEAALLAWRHLGSLRNADAVAGWLCRIAQNSALAMVRRRVGTDLALEDASAAELAVCDDDVGEQVARAATVGGLLSRLSDRDAQMLWRHHALGEPLRMIAATYGLTVRSAETALSRARRRARTVWVGGIAALVSVRARLRQVAGPRTEWVAALSTVAVVAAVPTVGVERPHGDGKVVVVQGEGGWSHGDSPVGRAVGASRTDGSAPPVSRSQQAQQPAASPAPSPSAPSSHEEWHVPGPLGSRVHGSPDRTPPQWRVDVAPADVAIEGRGDSAPTMVLTEVCDQTMETALMSCSTRDG